MSWRDSLAPVDATLREIIAVIDKSDHQVAMICAPGDRLVGIVTDGDVRRGILRKLSLDSPVTEVMNNHPTVISQNDGRARAVALMRQFTLDHIPVLDDDGRVVGLEVLFDLPRKAVKGVTVVIMAGGLGTRLAPLTDDVPKPLIHVGDKPILETIVEQLSAGGFAFAYICVNYKAEMISRHFGDGSKWNMDIRYVEEQERRGTAGALALLPEKPTGPVIVLNADLLTTIDFAALLGFHRAHSATSTVCVCEYLAQVPYGVAIIDNHHLIGLSEKPEHHFFINAGIYVLDPDVLDRIPPDGYFDMTTLIQQLVADGQQPMVYPIREYWLDIGHMDDLERARKEFGGIVRMTAEQSR